MQYCLRCVVDFNLGLNEIVTSILVYAHKIMSSRVELILTKY